MHVQVVGKGGFAAEVAGTDIVEGKNRLDIKLDEGELAGQIRGRVTARASGRNRDPRQARQRLRPI